MQRVRTAFLAVLAGGAVLALGACGAATPGTAATVSGTRITVDQVNRAVSGLNAHGRTLPTAQYGGVRQNAAASYVFTAIAKRYAQEQGYPAPQVDFAGVAERLGLREDDAFARTLAEADAYQQLLLSRATPVTPTESDLRGIFDRAVAAGLVAPGSFDQIKPQIQQISSVPRGIGLRNELVKAIQRYHVSVNPLYGALEFPLVTLSSQSGQSVVAVSLPMVAAPAGGTPAVTPAAQAPVPAPGQ